MPRKITNASVLIEATKDIPYFTSHEVDKANKIIGKPVEKDGKPLIQFKKKTRVEMLATTAGILKANGYLEILDENKDPVDTKALATK